MRFLSIWRPTTKQQQPSEKMQQEMGAFMAEALSKGVLLATEGFGPSSKSDLKVRLTRGEFTVTDGPFTEAKEVIGGFALMQVSSREEILEWTRRFMKIAGEGECEIHQLSETSPIDLIKQHRQ